MSSAEAVPRNRRWAPGEATCIRCVWRGRVWSAQPWTVVEDRPELLAAFMRPGTRWYMPTMDGPRGHRLDKLRTGEWDLVPFEWEEHSVLRLQRPGAAHSVWLQWGPDQGFRFTYINLEAPARRTASGIDTMDHTLDIVIVPDGSRRWKDEPAFARLEHMGIMSPEECSAIRREGELVLEELDGTGPWWADWVDWRPDPAWPVPTLPEGWDVLP